MQEAQNEDEDEVGAEEGVVVVEVGTEAGAEVGEEAGAEVGQEIMHERDSRRVAIKQGVEITLERPGMTRKWLELGRLRRSRI